MRGAAAMSSWPAVRPGLGLFELAGDPDQHVLAPVGRDELDADRQVVFVPPQGNVDRRLTADVERWCERNEFGGASHPAQRSAFAGVELADTKRRLAQRRSQQQVPAIGPPLLDP